jgi:dihydropteroate synthase
VDRGGVRAQFDWGARTYVMGIINVTPDSFSGDGLADSPHTAIELAQQMERDGADLIDIGGMSTRPDHEDVPVERELHRVMTVLPAVVKAVGIPVSIDSFRLEVVAAALEAGATVVNDVWGLKKEPELASLAAKSGALLILMHNQDGTQYTDLIGEVRGSLQQSVATALEMGMPRDRLVIDPGIGFGKTAEQNLEVMRHLEALTSLNLPVLLGTSRKSTIGKVLDLPVEDRVEGTAATVALGVAHGADMVRVHDVKQMVRVTRMADAIVRG